MGASLDLRLAVPSDVPELGRLIPLSVRGLQRGYYNSAQMEGALGTVFAVDQQLIDDGTYFVVTAGGCIIGAGGWSRRKALCGGHGWRTGEDSTLDPASDPARIRAFFVHPDHARRGIGTRLLVACEAALRAAGFRRVLLMATLAGEPLYAARGYRATERTEVKLPNGLGLPVVSMEKSW